MGKMFGNLTADNLEEAQDRVGGFQAIPSDIYKAEIKMAYAGQSAGGAHSVTVIADVNGQELRETVYITNKQGENFYKDKNDPSKRQPLPGFTTIDDLCLLTTGEPLAEQATTEKKVKVYDSTEKKEVPTDVPVLTGLLGKTVKLAVLRVKEFKQKQDDSGVYRDTNEVRTSNSIDKILDAETGKTVNEFRHEIETPEFETAWLERNKGNDRDKTASKAGGGAAGTGRPGGDAAAPKKKLFNKG